MTPDRFNALLEYVGVFFALYNSVILVRDGGLVAGVSVASTAFFTLWGVWNLYYYPHLGQRASGIAALGLVLSNGAWLCLVLLYRNGVL